MATFAQNFKVTDCKFSVPSPLAGGSNQALAETSAVQNYPLGTRVKAWDPVLGEVEAVYCKGVASTAAQELIQINPDFTTARVAVPVGYCGVALSANVANQFGWYVVKGRCLVKIVEDIGAVARCYMSATPGSAQDTAIAGSHVSNAVLAVGLAAGGSAIAGTADTTPAGQTIAALSDPYAGQAL